MSVQQALLARLRADPDDRDAWRVYGDWLLEQGDVRGELVALVHRLMFGASSSDERAALRQRVSAIEEEHRAEWLLGWVRPEGARLEWLHGFLVDVRLRWNQDTLAALDALVAHPAARLLGSLRLEFIGAEGARALACSEVLRGITRLHLEDSRIGAEGAAALAASSALRSLTGLHLRWNAIGDEGRAALEALERRGCRVST